jgi:lipopolysaccharide biosynthesis regulator YciM
VLAIARQTHNADMLNELGRRLRQSGGVSPRQLAWLLATAVPPEHVAQLPGISAQLGAGVDSLAEASSLSALLTRIGETGGRYQCDDCGLNSVRWYWHCPKCHAWDSLRPNIFKWAERAERAVRAS